MPQDTPYVTLQKNGKTYDFPRENLVKAKALGWMEVKGKNDEPVKPSLLDTFGMETARGMGLDPEKIMRMGGKSLGKQSLEAGREVLSQAAPFMERVAKDPFKIAEPFEAAATGIEKGVGSVWDALTTGDKNAPDFKERLVKAGGKLTGGLAGAAALGEAPESIEGAAALPKKVGEVAEKAGELPGKAVRTTVRSIADRDPAAVREAAQKAAAKQAESAGVQASNAKIQAARTSLEQTKNQAAKGLTENLNKTIDTIKTAFDAEYGDFDAKVLGKTPQNPKGTLPADISPVAQAVQDAKKNLIEGTEESNKQFDSIMQRIGKDRVDLGGGQLGPVPGQMIPAADLRGYITELESKVYDSNLLPDVRQAVKSVIEAGKKQVTSAIENEHGPQVVKLYKDLNSRYSDYLTDWRDFSEDNPLPKIRNRLLRSVMQKNPDVAADLDIAKSLTGDKGKTALKLLKKYEKFGAKPEILANYRKAIEQMDALPKEAKVPKAKPFDAQEFVKEGVAKRMRTMGHWGTGMAIVSFLLDVLHGNAGAMLTAAERVAAVQLLKGYLTGDKFLNWVSKEGPAAAKGAGL